MARKNLIRTNLFPYHVTIRCNNKEWFDLPLQQVWDICIHAIATANKSYPVNIQAFVLMSNHYHLMIWTPDANLDKFMFELNRNISKEIRKITHRINRIFGDRYKWSLITSDNYFFHVEKYIYQNPLVQKLVTRSEKYPYSTLHYLYHKKKLPFETKNEREITAEYLYEVNQLFEDRDLWARSLSRANFKVPIRKSSRRMIS